MRVLFVVAAILIASSVCVSAFSDICSDAELASNPTCPTEWKANDNCLLKRKGCMVPQDKTVQAYQYETKHDTRKGLGLDKKMQDALAPNAIDVVRKPLGFWELITLRKPLTVYHGGNLKLDKAATSKLVGSLFTGPYTVAKAYAQGGSPAVLYKVTLPSMTKLLLWNTHNMRLVLQGGLFKDEADHIAFTKEYDSYFFDFSKSAELFNQEDVPMVNDYYDCRSKDKPLCTRRSETVKDREFLEIICKQLHSSIDGIAAWTSPEWQEILLCNRKWMPAVPGGSTDEDKRIKPEAIPIV